MGNKKRYASSQIEASYKRAIRGKTLSNSDLDFTEKLLNDALYEILGKPGKSAGSAQNSISSSGTSSNGMNTSAYTAAQVDIPDASDVGSTGGGLTWISQLIGVGRDLLAYAHADKAAEVAYGRQREYADDYLTPQAQVRQYQEAGLNPMGLAGGNSVGASSAPSVAQGETPNATALTDVLGTILGYKARMAQVDVMKEDVASKIEYRASQKLYQDKINEWFEANQVVSIQKMQADTADALQRVQTGKSQEELNRAGVTQTQAEAALKIQEALQKEWENTPAFRNATVRLMDAQSAQSYANAQHAYEDIKNLETMRANIVADTALKYAQTDVGRQELINLGFTADQLKFAVDHQRGDLIWDRVGKVANALKDVGIGVGAAVAPIKGIPIGTSTSSQTSTLVQDGKGRTIRSTESFTTTSSNPHK